MCVTASVSRDGTLKLWDLQDDGNMRKTLKGTSKWIYSCAWSPDATMICTVGDSRSVSSSRGGIERDATNPHRSLAVSMMPVWQYLVFS